MSMKLPMKNQLHNCTKPSLFVFQNKIKLTYHYNEPWISNKEKDTKKGWKIWGLNLMKRKKWVKKINNKNRNDGDWWEREEHVEEEGAIPYIHGEEEKQSRFARYTTKITRCLFFCVKIHIGNLDILGLRKNVPHRLCPIQN